MAKRILIAEDERVLRESLAELLAEEGYEVLQAANGREVQQLILSEPVDLVLTDIRMPEMDGMTLLGYLKQAMAETPVILITAYGTVQSAVAAMRAGRTIISSSRSSSRTSCCGSSGPWPRRRTPARSG